MKVTSTAHELAELACALGPVEMATVRIRVRPGVVPPPTSDTESPASCHARRMRCWWGWADEDPYFASLLAGLSGRRLAGHAEAGQVRQHGTALNDNPTYGWLVLATVDALAASHGVEIWIAGAPWPEAPNHYRPMRLHERAAELGWE